MIFNYQPFRFVTKRQKKSPTNAGDLNFNLWVRRGVPEGFRLYKTFDPENSGSKVSLLHHLYTSLHKSCQVFACQ